MASSSYPRHDIDEQENERVIEWFQDRDVENNKDWWKK